MSRNCLSETKDTRRVKNYFVCRTFTPRPISLQSSSVFKPAAHGIHAAGLKTDEDCKDMGRGVNVRQTK